MYWYFAFALIGAATISFYSCNKEDDNKVPVLSTTEIKKITQTTAFSGGNITDIEETPITAIGVCWSTNQNPTINDSRTKDGTTVGSFSSIISGLKPNTTYFVRAYATNSAGTGYGSTLSFTTLEEVTDADGNSYATILIGNQIWFAENLRTTKYNDGSNIPTGHTNEEWASLSNGAYSIYPHSQIDNLNSDAEVMHTYGALYNWYAVETGSLCPTGWHVPTDAEWYAMESYIDPNINDPHAKGWRSTYGGIKLKTSSGWKSSGNGSDAFGFSALPGGGRTFYGTFGALGDISIWWSSSEFDETNALFRSIDKHIMGVLRNNHYKRPGHSVRCVRDN